jgi:hypothetical protein
MVPRKSRYGQWTVALAAMTVILVLPIAAGAKNVSVTKLPSAGPMRPFTPNTPIIVSTPKANHVAQRNGQRHASVAGGGAKHKSCGGGSSGPSGPSGGAPSGPVTARSPGPAQPVHAVSAC